MYEQSLQRRNLSSADTNPSDDSVIFIDSVEGRGSNEDSMTEIERMFVEEMDEEIGDEEDTTSSLDHLSLLSPWQVLIVDDEPAVHQVTVLALQNLTYAGRSVQFLSAYSAEEAKAIMAAQPDIAVVLLDVVMETNQAGFHFVRYLREVLQNKRTRLILRTGQPGYAPEEAIVRQYDINDYRVKTELTRQKLMTSLLISLRTYEQITALETNQHELETLYHHLTEYNSELQLAKESAEAASRAKDEFLSLMNHELRTPLNVILMRTEILDSGICGPLSAKQRKSLIQIRDSSHRLLSVIDDILDLAGMETGDLSVMRRPISARQICEQSVQVMQLFAEEKQITLRLQVNLDNVQIYADERRLLQILEKLLKNAIKFSADGGIVGIELTTDPQEGIARIAVWDEGIGIAPADIARLFQPFVQLEDSLTRRYEGAGLGLSIASRLTRLMGGWISVESEPGSGSCFTVTLPLVANETEGALHDRSVQQSSGEIVG